MIWILYSVLIALGALLVFMILRTIFTRPPKQEVKERVNYVDLDKDMLAKHLSEAVQIPTVSLEGDNKDDRYFKQYHKWLETTYPLLHAAAEKTVVNNYSLIYYIKGTDEDLKPACFLAHQDVVPAPTDGWEVDPFSGEIKDGFVYGRGSMDMKGQMLAELEAVEYVLSTGRKLKRGLYLCFGHDEEISSNGGAPYIVKLLKEKGVQLEFVVDEGGAMIDGKLLGIPYILGVIGTCEKGYTDITLTVKKDGGHASNPKRPTCVGLLAKAVYQIEKHPMKAFWNEPTKQLFKDLAPYMKHIFKFVMVNRDILSPLLLFAFRFVPMTNALVRTTFAPTMMEGANRRNVLPPVASANVNVRIATGNTSDQVVAHMQKTVGDGVTVEKFATSEPCPITRTDTPQFAMVTKSLKEVWPNLVTAPFMFIAADDARFYYELTPNVLRFTPFQYGLDDQKRIHGVNERTPVDALAPATNFFIRCLENSCF